MRIAILLSAFFAISVTRPAESSWGKCILRFNQFHVLDVPVLFVSSLANAKAKSRALG